MRSRPMTRPPLAFENGKFNFLEVLDAQRT